MRSWENALLHCNLSEKQSMKASLKQCLLALRFTGIHWVMDWGGRVVETIPPPAWSTSCLWTIGRVVLCPAKAD